MLGRREGRPSETIKLSILRAGLTDHETCLQLGEALESTYGVHYDTFMVIFKTYTCDKAVIGRSENKS